MLEKRKELYHQALDAKHLYVTGKIDREEAKKGIIPYLEEFNKASKMIAKKYNQRPRLMNLSIFLR